MVAELGVGLGVGTIIPSLELFKLVTKQKYIYGGVLQHIFVPKILPQCGSCFHQMLGYGEEVVEKAYGG